MSWAELGGPNGYLCTCDRCDARPVVVAGAGSTRLLRTEIGFAILRVRVGTVELLVYLLETFEKNAGYGNFRWFFSDLQVLYYL